MNISAHSKYLVNISYHFLTRYMPVHNERHLCHLKATFLDTIYSSFTGLGIRLSAKLLFILEKRRAIGTQTEFAGTSWHRIRTLEADPGCRGQSDGEETDGKSGSNGDEDTSAPDLILIIAFSSLLLCSLPLV